jgi:hypothetical protein
MAIHALESAMSRMRAAWWTPCSGHCSCISLCGTTVRKVDRRVEPATVLNAACPFTARVVRDAANCESTDHGAHGLSGNGARAAGR